MPTSDLKISITADASGVKQGASEAQSAIGDVTPKIEGLSKSFDELAAQFKEGLEGVHRLAGGFQAAGVEGAGALSGVAEAAEGVVVTVAALVESALAAASAMAEWATRTLGSNTASVEAKQNAADLDGALKDAATQFSAVSDTVANAFAPAVTAVATALAHLAEGFKASYDQGGTAKTIIDALAATFKLLAQAAELAVGQIVMGVETVRGEVMILGDAFQVARDATTNLFAVAGVGWETLGRVAKDVVSGDIASAVREYLAGVAQMEVGVGNAVRTIGGDMAKVSSDQLKMHQEVSVSSASMISDIASLARPPMQTPGPPVEPTASQSSPKTSRSNQGAQGQNDAAIGAAAVETATAVQANDAISASNQDLTQKYEVEQSQQAASSLAADQVKRASSDTTTAHINANNKSALDQFKSSIDRLVTTFSHGFAQMIVGSKSFVQVMRSMGMQILDDMFKVIDGVVEKWVWGVTENVLASSQGQALLNALGLRQLAAEIALDHARVAAAVAGVSVTSAARKAGATTDLAVSGEAGMKDIVTSAAQAASHAYSAMSGIPVVGPILGAAAAASVFAAVMAFKGLVSSAAGGFDIPSGVNPLTQLHAQEMVLPARLANPMRDMLSSYAAGGGSSGAGAISFGDFHVHGAPSGMSSSEFRQALTDHAAHVAGAVAGALRGGWRPSYKQPTGAL